MNLVLATGIFPPDIGGPATYVAGLAPELCKRGFGVEVVTYGEASSDEVMFSVARVSRNQSLPQRYGSYFVSVRKALARADLAYIQDPVSVGLPATLAALSRRKPTVLKVVGDLAWEIGRADGIVDDDVDDFQTKRYGTLVESMRKAQRFVARRAGAVITPSHYLKNLVIGWGVPSERVHVIENGARPKPETRLTREDARARLELDGDPILISAGRLVPWKGYEHIIDSMPAILRDHPRARLLIAGSGPCETALLERVQKLKLDDAVQLLGARAPTDLAMYLCASDVFVLVSTYEGFSHLLLEAMQSELPVVASRCGGNPELVGDADSGLLVSPDPRGAEAAIRKLLADPSLRARLGARGKRRVEDFTWEKMVARTAQLLQDAWNNAR